MPTYKTEAIVLKRRNFSEADKILTLFTTKKGKISVIAKGARRLKSKKGGNLDILNYCDILIAEGKDLDLVLEVQVKNSYLSIKRDLEKVGLSYFACEVVDCLGAERQKNRLLFEFLKDFLKELSQTGDKTSQKLLVLAFQFKVINYLGFFSDSLIRRKEDLNLVRNLLNCGFGNVQSLNIDNESINTLELMTAKLLEAIGEKKFKSRDFFNLIQKQKEQL